MSDEDTRKLSLEEEKIIDFRLGIENITIYLEISILNDLKKLAEKEGINYKSYIRRLLSKHVYNKKTLQ